jgi:hypothetical protein
MKDFPDPFVCSNGIAAQSREIYEHYQRHGELYCRQLRGLRERHLLDVRFLVMQLGLYLKHLEEKRP